ncbi:DoxX family protein [Saccharibacillus sacchari]|uniref:DoxX family protein n=1 Tax=Saccharibacillus sacchari TaxID=456493 RepID=UPI0004B8C675|nr:DoxX family protein [Saccharibacillus sacchari]
MTMKWTATGMRLVLGIIFLGHGISKLTGGIGNTADWFVALGLPGFLAYMIAMLELVCGTMMILGLLTRLSAVGFIAVMIGAIITVKLPAGLLGSNGSPGYELDLALMALAAYFIASKEIGVGVDSLLAARDGDAELAAAASERSALSQPSSVA